jgi:transposase
LSNGTSILFGLSGVNVQRVERAADGSRTVHVMTANSSAAGCPSCGVVSTSVKEHVTTSSKDLPYGESEISIRWHKTRWRCREVACVRGTFTEQIGEVPAGRRSTGRLRRAIAAAIGDAARSVAEVADAFGVAWPTAHAAFVEHADAQLGEPVPTPVLGIDETRRGKPRWVRDGLTGGWMRVDPYHTGFVDLAGAQSLLGQIEGRTSGCVIDWLEQRSREFREAVRFVAIDPAAVYAKAIRTPGLLPNAMIVVDHFHIVKLANDTLTKVRRRVSWDANGRRGRKIDPAWANRRRLLKARERLSEKGFAAMWNALVDSDPSNQILAAWIAKEELRALLALARTGATRADIDRRLFNLYDWCASTDIDELHTLAATVETWWPAILAFLHTGITNARTEGINRLVKQVKRSACGFRTITNQHRRVRFHCTRPHRATTAASPQLPAQS